MGQHSSSTPAFRVDDVAPGDDLLPAPRPVYAALPHEEGCWIDGVRGWTAGVQLVDIAASRGWPLTTEDAADLEATRSGAMFDPTGDAQLPDRFGEIVSDAGNFMNDRIAPIGYSFRWNEGDYLLMSDQGWCVVDGDHGTKRCWCV